MPRLALSLCCLLVATGSNAAVNLLDPSSWVDWLSSRQPSQDLEKWKRPDFWNSECPRYKLEKKCDEYEIRTYEGGKWAVTKVNETKYELAYVKATGRLMKYFKGGNDKGEYMDITTPTLARLKPTQETESTERDYSFSYWLPEEYQRHTPQPTDASVKLRKYGKATVYVRVFAGFATESTILDNTRALHESLKDDDQDYSEKELFVAVYDPPQKLLSRHNEIHVPVCDRKQLQPASA
ncbi:hypothetical protein N2152v2_001312 [Parachlorella kessleri]